jgi:hypothetical protein
MRMRRQPSLVAQVAARALVVSLDAEICLEERAARIVDVARGNAEAIVSALRRIESRHREHPREASAGAVEALRAALHRPGVAASNAWGRR